jgi:hypothetical protein
MRCHLFVHFTGRYTPLNAEILSLIVLFGVFHQENSPVKVNILFPQRKVKLSRVKYFNVSYNGPAFQCAAKALLK